MAKKQAQGENRRKFRLEWGSQNSGILSAGSLGFPCRATSFKDKVVCFPRGSRRLSNYFCCCFLIFFLQCWGWTQGLGIFHKYPTYHGSYTCCALWAGNWARTELVSNSEYKLHVNFDSKYPCTFHTPQEEHSGGSTKVTSNFCWPFTKSMEKPCFCPFPASYSVIRKEHSL